MVFIKKKKIISFINSLIPCATTGSSSCSCDLLDTNTLAPSHFTYSLASSAWSHEWSCTQIPRFTPFASSRDKNLYDPQFHPTYWHLISLSPDFPVPVPMHTDLPTHGLTPVAAHRIPDTYLHKSITNLSPRTKNRRGIVKIGQTALTRHREWPDKYTQEQLLHKTGCFWLLSLWFSHSCCSPNHLRLSLFLSLFHLLNIP